MVRPLGFSQHAVGRALVPLAAWVAVACGGSDFVDQAEAGPGASPFDAHSEDARPSGEMQPDSDRRDSN